MIEINSFRVDVLEYKWFGFCLILHHLGRFKDYNSVFIGNIIVPIIPH